MPEYSEREYWEQRYRAAGAAGGGAAPFDWYMDYAALKPALTALVPSLRASSRVLVLGCGTSPLGEQLYDDGFQQLTLVDFADGAVAYMQARADDARPDMQYRCMDVRRLALEAGTADVILDKGCLDCVLCDADPKVKVGQMLCHVSRVLEAGGTYVVVSHAPPDERLVFLEESRFAWSARCYVVHKPTLRELHDDVPVDCAPRPYTEAVDADAVYFVYVMVKHGC